MLHVMCSIFLLLCARDLLAMDLVKSVADFGFFADHELDPEDIKEANIKNNNLILKDAFGQRTELWTEITRDPYLLKALPTTEPSKLNSGHMLRNTDHLLGVFSEQHGPYPITGYVKHTHMYGVTGMVNVEMDNNSNFTGWFKEGGPALARFSLIKMHNGMDSFAPNISLMTFYENRAPKSIVAMCSVDGQQENLHFFWNSFTNIPGPANQLAAQMIEKKFTQVAAEIEETRHCSLLDTNMPTFLRLPLEEHASMTSEGVIIKDTGIPYEIIFIASEELIRAYQEELDKNHKKDFRKLIIKVMSKVENLFDIYVREEESAKQVWQNKWLSENGREAFYSTGVSFEDKTDLVHIGQIKRESEFVASKFADEMLYRHPSDIH